MDQEELNKADFIRYRVFIKVFDGSINRWKRFLKEKGSMDQVIGDYQFVLFLEKELKKDPGLLDRIKKMLKRVEEEL